MQEIGDIQNNGVCQWADYGEFTAEIFGDVKDLSDKYIRQLLKWAPDWGYDQVKWIWKESEDAAQSFGPGYYIIWEGDPKADAYLLHICYPDDMKGLFGGAWPDSPEPLDDWQDKITSMKIRISTDISWTECQVCGNPSPSDVYASVGCPYCGADSEEEQEVLDCDEQQEKGLCGECQKPKAENCDLRGL